MPKVKPSTPASVVPHNGFTVREVRTREGLELDELGNAIGLTAADLHLIEIEAKAAAPDTIARIAQRLRCETDAAFLRAGGDTPQNGHAIREIRTRAGLSHEDLGTAVGVSRTHLRNLETEAKVAKQEVIARIARTLDCPLAALTRDGGAYVLDGQVA